MLEIVYHKEFASTFLFLTEKKITSKLMRQIDIC